MEQVGRNIKQKEQPTLDLKKLVAEIEKEINSKTNNLSVNLNKQISARFEKLDYGNSDLKARYLGGTAIVLFIIDILLKFI